ncbi:MAG: type II secretion system protein [Patescibacteria group bacterium]
MKKAKGFTLVEILVVVALFGIISTIAGDILITVFRSYNKAKIIGEVDKNGNFALSAISQEIRAGSGFDTSNCTTGVTACLKYKDYNGNDSSINYYQPVCSSSANGRLTLTKGGASPSTTDLTSTNTSTGVSIGATTDPVFSITQLDLAKYVSVAFKVSQGCSQSIKVSNDYKTSVEVYN